MPRSWPYFYPLFYFHFSKKIFLINGEELMGGWMSRQRDDGWTELSFWAFAPQGPTLTHVLITRIAAPRLISRICTLFGPVVSEAQLLSALHLS